MTCNELINMISYWNGIAASYQSQVNFAQTQAASYYSQAEAQGCFGSLQGGPGPVDSFKLSPEKQAELEKLLGHKDADELDQLSTKLS